MQRFKHKTSADIAALAKKHDVQYYKMYNESRKNNQRRIKLYGASISRNFLDGRDTEYVNILDDTQQRKLDQFVQAVEQLPSVSSVVLDTKRIQTVTGDIAYKRSVVIHHSAS